MAARTANEKESSPCWSFGSVCGWALTTKARAAGYKGDRSTQTSESTDQGDGNRERRAGKGRKDLSGYRPEGATAGRV
ncbi:hypothetical protein AUEXF2481DRAFT_35017 [Aureobasidium subglaciale EXF-2481]|uniref:Uncharacterized protein n=1 Tax=Aureobasidium subglaciale (strain EXF-2481) TaxID=1043005 RepID=A0A074YSM1_AURSE|nr:uncharacterized protein AUEXF2481DRAFT_35017 [Aureobasidium subglaciale EXF-2481]KER00764.1 hypothetical protein AUEXF2481DRAFT_35017 [Aureobasidium subglaciale EXF-2481]